LGPEISLLAAGSPVIRWYSISIHLTTTLQYYITTQLYRQILYFFTAR